MSEKNPFYGATFAERQAIRTDVEDAPEDAKAVSEGKAENKSVKPAATRKKS